MQWIDRVFGRHPRTSRPDAGLPVPDHPPGTPSTTDAARLAADVEKLRSDQLALRESLLALREKELLTLSHEVQKLGSRFTVAAVAGGLVITLLGTVGLNKFADLNDLLNKTMQNRIDESLGYYDQVSRAMVAVNFGAGCANAVPALADLAERRPDDEVVFDYLTHCFLQGGEYVRATDYVAGLKAKGIFPKKLSSLVSLNNVGFLYFIRSLTDPSFEREARELLRKADQLGVSTDSTDLRLPLSNLVLLEVSVGRIDQARAYGKRVMDFHAQFPGADRVTVDPDTDWLRAAEARRPGFQKEVEAVMPGAIRTSAAASAPARDAAASAPRP